MSGVLSKVPVEDPFNAAADPALPTLALALDPTSVKSAFKRGLPRLSGPTGQVIVKSIRLIRYKPGKRAVIEYDVRVQKDDDERQKAILIGKIRAKRYGNEGYRLLDRLWNAGFNQQSEDRICVPEPIAALPKLRMWLQRKVKGSVATEALTGSEGVALARRVAMAIHKLHRAGVPTTRTHTIEDELRILRGCFQKVNQIHPQWSHRIHRIGTACEQMAGSLPPSRLCGIHRDFYPAQVIVGRTRLHLIDFDLYCIGDPALDVGNFIGHMTEESLRVHGDAAALQDCEKALEDSFLESAGEQLRPAVNAYTTLTLARHIYLSTQFPERAAFTEAIVALCERRLQL